MPTSAKGTELMGLGVRMHLEALQSAADNAVTDALCSGYVRPLAD